MNLFLQMMRAWSGYMSAVKCKWFAYGPAEARDTPSPSSLASLKSRTTYPGCRGKEAVKRVSVRLSSVDLERNSVREQKTPKNLEMTPLKHGTNLNYFFNKWKLKIVVQVDAIILKYILHARTYENIIN